MGKKTDGEEDPDGWRCKPIGKKGRGKKKSSADLLGERLLLARKPALVLLPSPNLLRRGPGPRAHARAPARIRTRRRPRMLQRELQRMGGCASR